MTQSIVEKDIMTFNAAIGFTVNQYMFAHGITRVALGEILGCSGPNISNRLRGKVGWPAEDIAIMSSLFGVEIQELYPSPTGNGGWRPAGYVPAHTEGPAPSGTGPSSSVAGAGFEPTTSGL